MKPPSNATLRKYGLTASKWFYIIQSQGNKCPICERDLALLKRHIDHEHVRGWKRMKPSERRTYVRSVLCGHCNRFLLTKGWTLAKLANACKYLAKYQGKETI